MAFTRTAAYSLLDSPPSSLRPRVWTRDWSAWVRQLSTAQAATMARRRAQRGPNALSRSMAWALLTSATAQQHGAPLELGELQGSFIEPVVEAVGTDNVQGYTTFTMSVRATKAGHLCVRTTEADGAVDHAAAVERDHSCPLVVADNVYALFGDEQSPMVVPEAFHVDPPFGCDIGGTNPAFWAVMAESEYDSWLSVSIVDGNVHNDISSIGVAWEDWTPSAGLTIPDGAVFWMNPDDSPPLSSGALKSTVLGQLTLTTGMAAYASVSAQGRSQDYCSNQGRTPGAAPCTNRTPDWESRDVIFSFFGGYPKADSSPSPPGHPPPPPQIDPGSGLPPAPAPNPCAYSQCENGSECVQDAGGMGYTCACRDGWGGGRCNLCPGHVANNICAPGPPPGPPPSQHHGGYTPNHGDGSCGPGGCPPPPPSMGPPPPPPLPPQPHGSCVDTACSPQLMSDALLRAPQFCSDPVHQTECAYTCMIYAGTTCSGEVSGHVTHPPVTPPPPPPSCADRMSQEFQGIQNVCCTNAGIDCSAGPPATCAPDCQGVVLGYWQDCGDFITGMGLGFSQLDEFVQVCERDRTDHGMSGKVTNALGSLASGGGRQYSCTYTELTGIALMCSSVTAPTDPATTAQFCASPCAVQLIPFSEQCAGTMAVALTTFGLTDIVYEMTSACSPATDDPSVCPIDIITQNCAGLSNPGGDASTLCATPCVESVRTHFEACSRSTDPHVVSVFSTDNWQPLIDLCSSLHPAASTGGGTTVDNIATQCDNIANVMNSQLAQLCCSDPSCSVPPTTCSTACSDALLPYFRDCGAYVLRHAGPEVQRLTNLATICSSHPPDVGGAHCELDLIEQMSTWQVAEDDCVSRGGHLASIHSDAELSTMSKLFSRMVHLHVWIGATNSRPAAQCDGSDFQWSDGSPMDYTAWSMHEPSSCASVAAAGQSQDCAEAHFHSMSNGGEGAGVAGRE